MDKVLSGLQGLICYQDDILIISRTVPEHIAILKKVFERLMSYNIQLNKDKCVFLQQQVIYLGHVIDRRGIHPTEQKVEAIAKMRDPENAHDLQIFLGMLNYYIKFIKNAADLLHPLHELLHKDKTWSWTVECVEAFEKCKKILSSDMVLTHYDNELPLTLACDASPYGLGVVLSHIINNEERPIAYASRTLTKAEKSYSQIEREALSIIFGLKHFNQYLYGRQFTIITDHRPLLKLFGPHSEVPAMAAARIQRWALLLSSFNYKIQYKKGREHSNADTLSRFPNDVCPIIEGEMFKLSFMEELPLTGKDIRGSTRKDAVLGRVINKIRYGWNDGTEEELQPYYSRREELSVQDDVILWGMRVVIPQQHRKMLLDLLHDTHPGITRMKSIARSHIWWPGIDKEIENYSKNCNSCEQNQKLPPTTALQSWIWPKRPWERVHVDYGQKGNQYFLIIVDSHSKWVEVLPTLNITSKTTIRVLRNTFARYGLPFELVSDNGPQFTAGDFGHFLKTNGVRHTLVPPYHPSSNGSAERYVQSFKSALEKMDMDTDDISGIEQKIARYLLVQHNTPHTTTGVSPAKLFMGRELRDRWALLHTDITERVENSEYRQKVGHDRSHSTVTSFVPGENVLARNGMNKPKWLHGTVVDRQSSKTWTVETQKGIGSFHGDQLRHREEQQIKGHEHQEQKNEELVQHNGQVVQEVENVKSIEPMLDKTDIKNGRDNSVEPRRNPPRNRKAPVRLDL